MKRFKRKKKKTRKNPPRKGKKAGSYVYGGGWDWFIEQIRRGT